MKISVGIDADMYPELYAKLSSLGKGARSEMLRKLASEALNNRAWAEVAARNAPSQAQFDAAGSPAAQGPSAGAAQARAAAVSTGSTPAAGAPQGRDSGGAGVAHIPAREPAATGLGPDDSQQPAPTARFAAGRMSNALLRG